LSARGSLTTAAIQAYNNAPGKRIGVVRSTQWSASRLVMRPQLLVLFGLLIAVVLWGEGYKLSLYFIQTAPSSRIPVAKLWIECRNASVTAASRCKSKPNLLSVLQPLQAIVQLPRCRSFNAPFMIPVCRCGIAYFDFHIPSRSPPPRRFLAA